MSDWETVAAAHRQKQFQSIPEAWRLSNEKLDLLRGLGTTNEGHLIHLQSARLSGLLTGRELDITQNFSARELLRQIHSQTLRAEDVIVAFCKRAAVAQQLTTCLTEIFFGKAIERARWLDRQLAETGKVVGPLHGLPISLKDSFHVEGEYATVGYVEFLRHPPPTSNAALVQLLLNAGAVLYCKTNVPQTMMTADSENNVFGRTVNPHNTTLTAGGSSGGEGALVSFRGSILGVGTDVAGSIRIPSLCCGVYGFKPTADRIPFQGQSLSPFPIHWLSSVMPVAGPLATSVDDLFLFMETVAQMQPWKYDASAVTVPWRQLDTENERVLTIGILPEDAEYSLHPSVRRIVKAAGATLEKAGHRIVHLPSDLKRSVSLGARIAYQYFGISSPEGKNLAETFGEPLVASVARGMHPFSNEEFPVSPQLARPAQFHNLNIARGAYAEAWKDTWQEHHLDVVLGPGAVSTAVPHDTYGLPVYTVMWNLIDYPAAMIPFGSASKSQEPEGQNATMEFVPDYIPEATDGAPGAIQIIAPRFQDEECLRAVCIIDQLLNPRAPPASA